MRSIYMVDREVGSMPRFRLVQVHSFTLDIIDLNILIW